MIRTSTLIARASACEAIHRRAGDEARADDARRLARDLHAHQFSAELMAHRVVQLEMVG